MIFIHILSATILVSLISLIGIFTLGIKTKIFDKLSILLVGFAAGGLIGGAFLHLLPEAVEQSKGDIVFFYALLGFTIFFLMERYFYWRHCHDGACDVHSFTYLNLIGDGLHNFTDGLIIAASFLTDFKLGVVTTLAVIFHEIPQEMGDFGILVYGGFSKRRALFFNFICSLSAVLGACLGYILSGIIENISLFLIPFTAGGFIYIASSDLIPELHKQKDTKRANLAFIAFILGLVFMGLAKMVG
ncbi:MAG: ZIP family metal transporter [Candidatus Omnitrophica bacterium]|nr:ZIP family metal transporter [Candidatus Omnitrophota bacterium]MBU0896080.1 ZIP family metal transporter [Candidatus Omnitrophota bacterium]MBU1134080.1 ZIP family metal transporter [Candidatus Omnitrophota bacterium]MBU1367468.1 ZIP family metal transporter [Candidatus Omnitrophota bacterium]MBU1523778.1 ZIP family metal transporter [Candidatus Omnitrophota bacterium]